ncbi:MAG TPA: hypothetical protein VGB98_09575 [Pyrinomonadaceae bacterium]|jgi:hypothetical protein
MENDSQNVEKKKRRGRPRLRLFTPEVEAMYEACGVFDGVRTARTRQNVMYRQRAMDVLGVVRDERFKWLCDVAKVQADEPNAMKHSILAELGRIEDADKMRVVALQVCEMRPTAREAVQIVRNFRTGKQSKGDVTQLTNEIYRLIVDYLTRHPAMRFSQVSVALSSALEFNTRLAMRNE